MTLKRQRSTIIFQAVLAASLLLGLAGCAVGPDYVRPQLETGGSFKEAVAPSPIIDWKVAEPGTADATKWWLVFGDATLNGFMPQLAEANPDIATAAANLRAARAAVREATAPLLPAISAGGEASRGQSGGNASVANAYRAQLAATWEIDLFGGARRGRESAAAAAQAAEADLAAMLLAMRAELAQNYFQLRSYDEQIELYRQTVAAFERSLRITRNQHAAGTVTRLDVAQAEAQLENARAQAVALDLQRRQTEHAIAALMGMPPSFLTIPAAPLNARLPSVEPVIPAVLLERRPDIAAAERRMASANARIGVAQSAFFPAISLGTSGAYAGDAFRELFTVPNRIWSLGASLAQSVFQGGAILARKDRAVADWEASVATYRKTVLSAFTEIEDQLAATALLDQEERIRQQALGSARNAEQLALNQYKGGIVTYLSVVSAQATALESARNAAVVRGRRFLASVALIRALGGGWDPSFSLETEHKEHP